MEKTRFEKDLTHIRRGNHVSNVDAEYCTLCHDDLAHPLFDYVCKDNHIECPHMRTSTGLEDDHSNKATTKRLIDDQGRKWEVAQTVNTSSGDGTMGPAVIMAFYNHNGPWLAVLRYPKYDEDAMPCYRPAWLADLVPYVEPKPTTISRRDVFLSEAMRSLKERGIAGSSSEKLLGAIADGLIKFTEF